MKEITKQWVDELSDHMNGLHLKIKELLTYCNEQDEIIKAFTENKIEVIKREEDGFRIPLESIFSKKEINQMKGGL